MALSTCPYCGRALLAATPTCPRCRRPTRRADWPPQEESLAGLGCLVALVLFAGALALLPLLLLFGILLR